MASRYKYYLSDEYTYDLYVDIKKPGSTEEEVDAFWGNVLHDYFPRKKGFTTVSHSRPNKLSNKKSDIIVRYFRHGKKTKIIFFEDKRSGKETASSEWRKALTQVEGYAKLSRAEDGEEDDPFVIYLAVSIGTYVRFYQLNPFKQDSVDWAPARGQIYEIAINEEQIHTLLITLSQAVAQETA